MKGVLFILGLLYSTAAIAQTDSFRVWNKWCAKKDTMLLFTAANNLIQVYSPTLKPADIKLKSLDYALRIGAPEVKGDTISVMAMPYPGKGKNMRLAIQDKKGKTLKTITFYSAEVPAPIARVGKIKTNEAFKKEFLAQQALTVDFPGSFYNYPYRVKQYTVKMVTEKSSITVNAVGSFLSKELIQQVKDAPAGTMIEFSAIKATCPECITKDLPDIKLKIK